MGIGMATGVLEELFGHPAPIEKTAWLDNMSGRSGKEWRRSRNFGGAGCRIKTRHQTEASMTTLSLVTGGSRGLGRNTALSIARHGGDVILTYRSGREDAETVVPEIDAVGRKALALQLGAGIVSSLPAFVETLRAALAASWGRDTIDHLVNNAGHGEMADFAATTEAQFDKLFDVHVKGVFFLTQALLPVLADSGRII